MTEREAYIALNLLGQIGPVRARALAAHLGSLTAIFEASEQDLRAAEGIGVELAAHIVRSRGEVDPSREEAEAARLGARIVTPVDTDYPEPLQTIHDPPLALYVVGTWTPRDRHAVAVVGSRRCTHYGRATADRLAAQLASAGVTVVSGLARGIDTAAHEGALRADGRTIAVLGGAVDRLYPAEARPLADRIACQGAVISEYALGREPDRTTFPYRNRIISGLSMGVVIVEADRQSGAMITAAQALDQGRLVFAVPGRVDQPMSRGPHSLIRQGAKLVEDARDVLEEFEYLFPRAATAVSPAVEQAAAFSFSEEEERVVEALKEGELDADTLARRAALPPAKLGALLVGLEIKRVVRMLPGRLVALTVRPRSDDRSE